MASKGIISILYPDSQTQQCGGVIFKPRRVLTAYHCVDDQPLPRTYIRAKSLFSKSQGELAFVVGPVRHLTNTDIAVLILDRDITTTYVKIPDVPAPDNRIDIIAGWGYTDPFEPLAKSDKLRVGTMKITDTHWDRPGEGIQYQSIVDGGNPARPCDYDSGGPLFFVNSAGLWAVHGTIWGGSGICFSPAYSTKLAVPSYRYWILSQ